MGAWNRPHACGRIDRRVGWVSGLAVLAAFSGCRAAPKSLSGTVFDPDQPPKYVLHPGDELLIRYPSDSSLDQEVTIRTDGNISLPYVGDVQAALKSPAELSAELDSLYAGILKHPSVTVIVQKETGRRVYVGGEVDSPGTFLLHPNETLAQALLHAGGLTVRSKSTEVMVLRACPGKGIHVLRADFARILNGEQRDVRLQPLDIVYVPKTAIARVGDFVDQYINRVVPRPFSALFTYELHVQPIEVANNQATFPVEITRGR